MNQDILNNAVRVGEVTSCTVLMTCTKQRCIKLKTFRDAGSDIILSKQEWEAFLKFANLTLTDTPCVH